MLAPLRVGRADYSLILKSIVPSTFPLVKENLDRRSRPRSRRREERPAACAAGRFRLSKKRDQAGEATGG